MKKGFWATAFITISFLFISFFSCQPEVQPYTQGTDSTGGLLMKIDGRSGNDTVSVTFRYDSQKRWIGSRIFSSLNSDTTRVILSATRDGSGFLTQCTSIDSSVAYTYGVDTTIYLITHNAATGQYLRTVATYPDGTSEDTSQFVYDNAGKIIKQIRFYGYNPIQKDTILFQYNGNNMDSMVEKLAYGGLFPNSGAKLGTRYDNKISPLVFGNEGIVIQMPYLYGMGNLTMFTHTDTGYLLGQGVITYTYNSSGKPMTATITMLPANRQCVLHYHYQ